MMNKNNAQRTRNANWYLIGEVSVEMIVYAVESIPDHDTNADFVRAILIVVAEERSESRELWWSKENWEFLWKKLKWFA